MALTLEQYAAQKELPHSFLEKKLGLRNGARRGKPVVLIPYWDANGEEACVRIRAAMDGGFFWETGAQLIPYGLWRKDQQGSKYICLVEGESDTQTLWLHRFPALGLPGAASWNEEWAEYFDRYERIYVMIEPDKGGEAVQKWIRTSKIRNRVRLITLEGAKDPSELYCSDPDNFKRNWKAAMKAAVQWSQAPEEVEQRRLSQATFLLSLADEATLFHTPDFEAFAIVPVNEHKENWPLKSNQFRQWLLRGYFTKTKGAPQSSAVQEALGSLESRARFDGAERPVFLRVAEKDGKIYLDLCNAPWEVVEIDGNGWRILPESPVQFRRARGMAALPLPTRGGDVEQLREFVNVANNSDWILLESWLIAALRGRGPYPILVLHGEQGSAKSTTARVLRALVDPSTAPLRSEPREVRDLMIAATNGWIVSLDNISKLPPWQSDALCRLATGGGFSTRELYSDREETILEAQRPVILNGIEELAVRGDLLDRALMLDLPSIPEGKRRAERSFWAKFETCKSSILGALLDAASSALRRLPKVRLPGMPRMADFALWATAAESSLGWENGSFLRAYTGNQSAANALALDASPITEPLRAVVADGEFIGTATALLKKLEGKSDDATQRQKGWPKNGQGVSNTLRRLAPNLRKSGIKVDFDRKNHRRGRLIFLREIASTSSTVSAKPSADKVGRG